jgi:hypothetical protein
MYPAFKLAALTSEFIVAGSRDELDRRLSLLFPANKYVLSHRTLLCLMIYSKNEEQMLGRTHLTIFLCSAPIHTSCLSEKYCVGPCYYETECSAVIFLCQGMRLMRYKA